MTGPSSTHRPSSTRVRARCLCARLLRVVFLLTPFAAQGQRAGNGFLFAEPPGGISLRGGFAQSKAAGDIFQLATNQLTLTRRDFDGITADVDLAIRLSSRTDLLLSSSYSGANAPSEFREWLDENDLPITQVTAFKRVPVTVGLRTYLLSRGRSVSRFAWIPATYAPYVGVGAGAMWYQFKQTGDFVDFADSTIFSDALQSSGWTPTGNLFAGVDYNLSPQLALTAQGKYSWARGTTGDDFQGFGKIDLSGFALTLGLFVRF